MKNLFSFLLFIAFALFILSCGNGGSVSSNKSTLYTPLINTGKAYDSIVISALHHNSAYPPIDSSIQITASKDSILLIYLAEHKWPADNAVPIPDWDEVDSSNVADLQYVMTLKMKMVLSPEGNFLSSKIMDTIYNYYIPVLSGGEDSSVKVNFSSTLSAEIENFTFNDKPIRLENKPYGDSVGLLTKKNTVLKSDYGCEFTGGEIGFKYVHVLWKGRKKGYWVCEQDGMFSHEDADSIGNWSDEHITMFLRKR